MTLLKDKYRVESARLKDWDYASAGWYFVTVCTRKRECLFGDVVQDQNEVVADWRDRCRRVAKD